MLLPLRLNLWESFGRRGRRRSYQTSLSATAVPAKVEAPKIRVADVDAVWKEFRKTRDGFDAAAKAYQRLSAIEEMARTIAVKRRIEKVIEQIEEQEEEEIVTVLFHAR